MRSDESRMVPIAEAERLLRLQTAGVERDEVAVARAEHRVGRTREMVDGYREDDGRGIGDCLAGIRRHGDAHARRELAIVMRRAPAPNGDAAFVQRACERAADEAETDDGNGTVRHRSACSRAVDASVV